MLPSPGRGKKKNPEEKPGPEDRERTQEAAVPIGVLCECLILLVGMLGPHPGSHLPLLFPSPFSMPHGCHTPRKLKLRGSFLRNDREKLTTSLTKTRQEGALPVESWEKANLDSASGDPDAGSSLAPQQLRDTEPVNTSKRVPALRLTGMSAPRGQGFRPVPH